MREQTSPIHNPQDRDSHSKRAQELRDEEVEMKSFLGVKYGHEIRPNSLRAHPAR